MPSLLSRTVVAAFFSIGLSGCAGLAGLGSLEDILSAGGVYGSGSLNGEIRRVDTRRQEIELQAGRGRTERVRYDGRTQVVYGQRRYDVRSLERGDMVRMRVDEDRWGDRYASVIEVERSVRDRRGGDVWGRSGRLERLGGTVGRVDGRQGWFELYTSRSRGVMIMLPNDPSRSVRDRFRRLRRGDRITVEAYPTEGGRAELYRFR